MREPATGHTPDELLQMAMAAAENSDHDLTMALLDRALSLDPLHARAHYLRAAQCAHIGHIDQAVSGMTMATRLDPGLYTAHFQLGLLHLAGGAMDAAITAWSALDCLGESHTLYLFKTGLIALAEGRFLQCREYLVRGMSADSANEMLNHDMRLILERLPDATANIDAPDLADHVFLSAYRAPEDDGDDDGDTDA